MQAMGTIERNNINPAKRNAECPLLAQRTWACAPHMSAIGGKAGRGFRIAKCVFQQSKSNVHCGDGAVDDAGISRRNAHGDAAVNADRCVAGLASGLAT